MYTVSKTRIPDIADVKHQYRRTGPHWGNTLRNAAAYWYRKRGICISCSCPHAYWYQNRITQLEANVANLQALITDDSKSVAVDTGVLLYQNVPNPANNTTRVQYYIPPHFNEVFLAVFDSKGIQYELINLTETEAGFIDLDLSNFDTGTYIYSLIVDGMNAASKQMIVAR